MDTKIVQIVGEAMEDSLQEAGEIIRSGGVVAFPTETVYGLGGNALDASAIAKIFQAKGRPSDNPLIVHIAEKFQLSDLVSSVSPLAQALMDTFWPGPLTLVFQKKEVVPLITTGGLDTVAVRMPSHPVALQLIRASGCPIAAPSANRSGRPSPTQAMHVFRDLEGRIPLILDGGSTQIGLESTVLDVSGETPRLLRPGSITQDQIEHIIGSIESHKSLLGEKVEVEQALAPGMKYRHYSPTTHLVLFEGSRDAVSRAIENRIDQEKKRGKKVVVLTWQKHHLYSAADHVLFLGNDEASLAHNLFAALRQCDDLGVDIILGEGTQAVGLGLAIMNRYRKAAIEIQTV